MEAMAVIVEATAVIVEATAVIVVGILNLKLLTPNPLVLKVGKIEVMEIRLKIPNMKVVEVEEKEEFLMMVMSQKRKVNNPFLQAY